MNPKNALDSDEWGAERGFKVCERHEGECIVVYDDKLAWCPICGVSEVEMSEIGRLRNELGLIEEAARKARS